MNDASTETGETADGDGELVEVDGRPVLRFVRRYDAAIEDVWDAITSADRLARWAFRTEIEPRAGGTVRFDFGDAGDATGTVLAWEPLRLLECVWEEGEDRWHIRYRLDAIDDGTTLTFDHLLPEPPRADFAAGWHWHLDRLATVMDGGEPAAAATDEHFERLQAHYRRLRSAD